MKKYLTVFAVLALGGCAHAEYQAGFLDEYADYSCSALRGELSESRQEMERYAPDKRRRGRAMAAAGGARYQSVDLGGDFTYVDLVPPSDGGPPRWWGKYHRERMQAHARHQSLLQLMTSRGCSG
ncbi:MAG: hypothetical protein OXH45_03560 [Gammaproteobacteria bacterium]|nr:hypothetical protein [Gammaproteobacteria bacterium]